MANIATLQAYSFYGQPGWWRVPDGFYSFTDGGGQIWASPNPDYSNPVYACKINVDGTMVFQDAMLNRVTGIDSYRGIQMFGSSVGQRIIAPTTPTQYTFNGLPPLNPMQYLYLQDRVDGNVYGLYVNQANLQVAVEAQAGQPSVFLIDLYNAQVKEIYMLAGEVQIGDPISSASFYQSLPFIDLATGFGRTVTLVNGNLTVT